MLSDDDRSQLARHEAFLSLSSEMIALGNLNQVAKLLVSRLKYVTNVFSWRYLSINAASASSQVCEGVESADVFIIDGFQEEVRQTNGSSLLLSRFEQDAWQSGKAAFLDSTALAEYIEMLPAIFQHPEIEELYVCPQWGRDRLEGLFFTSVRGAPFDKLDIKFIGLASLFFHRKVDYLRNEKRLNDELVSTVNCLRLTQDDLIQSEKLASLGSLVAGVSHELNTPIGNALLISCTLMDHLKELDALLKAPAMRRSDLIRWRGGAVEMGDLINRSITRAAALIDSFKQVAIDQSSDRRRVFDLHDDVEDVLAALRPGLKRTPWVVDNEIPKGIECDTFPGPLGQIVTNLIQNAILHGFEGRTQGRVVLDASVKNGIVELTVTDDGIGIDASTLPHIFEPFFTTKLGRGGSGMGLPISHRIATTVLAGELRVSSVPGAGTRFMLSMPQRTPHKVEHATQINDTVSGT